MRKVPSDWYQKYRGKTAAKEMVNVLSETPQVYKKKQRVASVNEEVGPNKIKDLVENLSVKEVAQFLRCDKSTVYSLIKSRELRCQPYGKRRKVVALSELHAYLKKEKEKYYDNAG
jgi:excisionase family DNA binding protein